MKKLDIGLSKFHSYLSQEKDAPPEIISFRETARELDVSVLELYKISTKNIEYGFFESASEDDSQEDTEAEREYGLSPRFTGAILSHLLTLNNERGSKQNTEGVSFKGKRRASAHPKDQQLGLLELGDNQ